MSKITIEQVRNDGNVLSIVINTVDACLDEGFVVDNKIVGAIKLIKKTNTKYSNYFVIGAHSPSVLTVLIKRHIQQSIPLRLPYRIFDPPVLSNAEAFKLLASTGVNYLTLEHLIKNAPNKTFIKLLEREGGRYSPKSAHIFARCLPTPGKPEQATKFQFFKYLLLT